MNFNFNSWKQSVSQNIKGWRSRFKNAGINSLYYGLTATSLLPVVQAYHTGEVVPALIALGGVSAGLGANLLANKIQGWKDKNEAQIAVDLQTAPELKELLDQLLEKMETLAEAQKDLPTDNEQLWFEKTLKEELTKIGSRVSFQTTLTEGGAIAQGDGAMAVGTGGIIVGGDMNNATIMQGENARKIDAGTYIEKQVIESPNPEKEKKAKAREKYLNRLSRVCLSLPLVALGGVDGDESDITLDKIYIALNITEQRQRDEEVLDKEAIQEYREKREFWTGEELNPALESVAKHKKLALLGDPGAGKSTFVKNLLAWQAGLMLGKIQVSNGIESELLPALIILRDLTPRLANVEIDSLPTSQRDAKLTQIVWEHMQADLGKECADFHEGLSEALHSGKCLLVLDGLDEVPHDLRVRVRQAVDALFKQYHLQRAIITCRVRSYVGETILPSFESRTLAPFDEDQIRNFVEHWYTTQHTLGKFNEEQAKDRMNDLSNAALEDDMQELSSNPMLLTTMAIIHQREVGLPRERVRLYQQAVEVLLRRWQKHKVGDAALADFLKNDLKLRTVMEALAYQAHRASTKESGTGSLLRKDALDLLESDMLLGNMHLAVEFLDYVDQRAGLLVGNGAELNKPTVYSFPHRTFQEYLAGAYLARQRDRVRTFYEHAAEGDSWDLAAQLAFEELYYNRRSENELLDLAYQLDNPSATGEQCERARLWAGQIIILVGKEVTERDTHPNGGKVYLSRLIPSLASILASQVLRIHERASTGNILATLGDPRFNIELCSLPLDDLLGFVHIPAGRFLLGSVNSDPIADETEKPQHEVELSEYWIANYPVTVSQFNFFLKETNYCFKSGPLEQVPNHPITSVTWYDAMEYTKWLSKELLIIAKQKATSGKKHPLWDGIAEGKLFVTLPTEQEWEKSARSGYNNVVYPWGNEFNSEKSNTFETGIRDTITVGCLGENLFGVSDLCGNVWEWTRSILCKYPILGNPPKAEQIKDTDIIILRGGSYTHDRWFARNSSRGQNFPNVIRKDHGFRVVISQANI